MSSIGTLQSNDNVFISQQEKVAHFQTVLDDIRSKNLPMLEFGEALTKIYAQTFCPKPPSQYKRSHPCFTRSDTVEFTPIDALTRMEAGSLMFYAMMTANKYSSRILSGKGILDHSFKDEDIVEVAERLHKKEHDSSFYRGMTADRRHIIQQNGIRGCTIGSACMLVSDRLGQYVAPTMQNLGNDRHIIRFIHENGLKAISSTISSLDELSMALSKNGPATISVDSVGSHQIVVDRISENGVDIRDPFHGWAVTITKEAFLNSLKTHPQQEQYSKTIIQAVWP